jgi:hypothetical protein
MIAETFIKKAHFTDAIDAAQAAIQCKKLGSSSAHFLLYKLYEASSFKNWNTKLKAIKEKILSFLLIPFDKIAFKNSLKSVSLDLSYPRPDPSQLTLSSSLITLFKSNTGLWYLAIN